MAEDFDPGALGAIPNGEDPSAWGAIPAAPPASSTAPKNATGTYTPDDSPGFFSDAARQKRTDDLGGYANIAAGAAVSGVGQAAQILATGPEQRENAYNKGAGYIGEETAPRGPYAKEIAARQRQQAAARERAIADAAAAGAPQDRPLYRAGQAIKDYAGETFPATQEQRESIPGQVAAIGGNMLLPMLMGPVAGPLGAAAGAGYMGLQSAGETFDAALQKGATPEQAADAAGTSGMVNAALGGVPLSMALAPIKQWAPGLGGWAMAKLAQAGANGVTFAGFGEAQNYINSQIEKAYYNPESQYDFDLKRAFAGFIAGAGLVAAHPIDKTERVQAADDANRLLAQQDPRAQRPPQDGGEAPPPGGEVADVNQGEPPPYPVATERPGGRGIRLLPPDAPHLPPPDAPLRSSVGAAGNPEANPLADAHPEAVELLRQKLQENIPNEHVAEQLLDESSEQATLGHMTPGLRTFMGGIARAGTGEARNTIVGTLHQMRKETEERVSGIFNRYFGDPVNIAAQKRAIDAETKKNAAPFWKKFRDTVIPPTPEIEALMPRLQAAGALQAANKKLAIEGLPSSQGFTELQATGRHIPSDASFGEPDKTVPTAQAFQYAKEHLDSQIEDNLAKPGHEGDVRIYTMLKNDLVKAVDNHPDQGVAGMWKEARDVHVTPERVKKAFDFGKNVLTNRVHRNELPFLMEGLGQREKMAVIEGVREHLEDRLGNPGNVELGTLNTILGRSNQEKLAHVLGAGPADALIKEIKFEHDLWQQHNPIIANSVTSESSQVIKQVTHQPGGMADVPGALLDVAHLNWVKTGSKAAIKFALRKWNEKQEAKWKEIRADLARLLTLQGAEKRAVLRELIGAPPGDEGGFGRPSPLSPRQSLQAALDRNAPLDELANHPMVLSAVAENRARLRTGTEADFENPEWQASRVYRFGNEEVRGWDAAVARLSAEAEAFAGGAVENGHHAIIVLGPPAAGKSSLSEPIAKNYRAAIVDADEAKKAIPEYQNGLGTSAVHEESSALSKDVLAEFIAKGANVVLPKVGQNADSIRSMVEGLKSAGYTVDIAHIQATPEISGRRNIARFLKTGRLVEPGYIAGIGDLPRQTAYMLKGEANDFVDASTANGRLEILEGSGRLADGLRDGGNDLQVHAQGHTQGDRTPQATGSGQQGIRGPLALTPHRVTAADGTSVDVHPRVVEADSLFTSQDHGYDPALQPRERNRAAAQVQVQDIANNLDPERLGYSAEADRGAPIVGPDGMVESGNGRVLALRAVYNRNGPKAQEYRDWLTRQGVDVSGFRNPILVRQRATPMTPDQRQAFTVAANQAATMAMSAPERAMADARILDHNAVALLANPNDLGSSANRPFIRKFVAGLPQSEQGTLVDTRGSLSSEGLVRLRNAVLAKAYGDGGLLVRIAESTNDDVKSISNALTTAAPAWAKMRAAVESGEVRADMDITTDLMDAVARTAEIRQRGVKLDNYLNQRDAFDPIPKRVEDFMQMFYDQEDRRAATGRSISDALKFYADEAKKVSNDPDLGFGLQPVRPEDIQSLARKKQQEEQAYGRQGRGIHDRVGARNGEDNAAGGEREGGSGPSTSREGAPEGSREGDQGQKPGTAEPLNKEADAGTLHYPFGSHLQRQVGERDIHGRPLRTEPLRGIGKEQAILEAGAERAANPIPGVEQPPLMQAKRRTTEGQEDLFGGPKPAQTFGEKVRQQFADRKKIFRAAGRDTPPNFRLEEPDAAKMLSVANKVAGEWQDKLGPDIKVVMGGSLVSHTYARAKHGEPIDMDIRFLTDNPERDYPKVEAATGLKLRKSRPVDDYPSGSSKAFLVEGPLTRDGITYDVEAAVRTPAYVGWAKFYPKVLTPDELSAFRGDKVRLKDDKEAYKALKGRMLTEVKRRIDEAGGPEKVEQASANPLNAAPETPTAPAPLKRNVLQRDASGRPMRTAPIPIGTEDKILQAGFDRSKGPEFYSAAERAVSGAKQEKASPDQWLGMLKNMPGVKPEEMEWLGLADWLKQQKGAITKQQVADYVRANAIEVREVEKGGPPDLREERISEIDAQIRDLSNYPADPQTARDPAQQPKLDELLKEWDSIQSDTTQAPEPTKFGTYVLPGGKNYREMLLTLPEKSPDEIGRDFYNTMPNNSLKWEELPNATKETFIRTAPKQAEFKSSHWDEPNVLAHIRMNDRVIDGKKTLLVEEIQSDLHQQGKRHGYKLPAAEAAKLEARRLELEKQGGELRSEGKEIPSEVKQEWADIMNRLQPENNKRVPDAPFKTTWPELSMKRMIRYAAENGYEKFAWTPGEAQAARYDLSKQISRISLGRAPNGEVHFLKAFDHGNNEVINKRVSDPGKELPDIIGKEAAEKLLAKESERPKELPHVEAADLKVESREHDWRVATPDGRSTEIGKGAEHTEEGARDYAERYFNRAAANINQMRRNQPSMRELRGLDLKVGGEGMKGFYDQILPSTVNKLVKKFGAKVGEGKLPEGDKGEIYTREGGAFLGNARSRTEIEAARAEGKFVKPDAKEEPVHTVDITPTMRHTVFTQGFPQFSSGGAVTTHTQERADGGLVVCKDDDIPEHQSAADWRGDAVPGIPEAGQADPFSPQHEFASGGGVDTEPPLSTRKDSHYSPTGGTADHRCGECSMFRAPHGCTAVFGYIVPNGVCDYFKPKIERASGGRVMAHYIDHNPTEAQKAANNYRHAHINVHGLDISIENAKGSERSGVGPGGKRWAVILPASYGYIKRTTGADSDNVDCYVGPHRTSRKVFVIDQHNAETGEFDEGKTMLCFGSAAQARAVYLKGFSDGKGKARLGHMVQMDIDQFRSWLRDGDTTKPIKDSDYDLPTVDRDHDVRWISELSRDGRTFYIDRTLPRQVKNNGKMLDPAQPLLRHEHAEYKAMRAAEAEFRKAHGREPKAAERTTIYKTAHRKHGNVAEKQWIESNGYLWAPWEAWCRGELSRLENRRITNPPPNPDVKPAPHRRGDLEETISHQTLKG